ncbi:MAG: hypothetical protein M1833_004865 [Piccolia ochrophora]|nr:MAG: hypothetical protein M1833_004865 [Piccolia ochrophora]
MFVSVLVGLFARHWPVISFLGLLVYLSWNRYHHGLSKYPGPLLASLTDWWRFVDVWSRRAEVTHRKLHDKHGDIVRLGPNVLSFGDPQALKTIYGLKKGFVKSEFYPVQQSVSKGQRLPSLFSTTNEDFHAALRRSVNSAFSMSTLLQYEQFVDSTTEVFLDQIEQRFARTGAICDLSRWLQYYAFDVIGELTYSKRHGFVDRGEDVDGIIDYLGSLFSYVAPIGQIPGLDLLMLKNPLLLLLDRLGIWNSTFPVVSFAKARMAERTPELSQQNGKASDGRADLLSKFFQAQVDRPNFMDDSRVLTMAVSMAFAGSETTAISLTAIFYFLLKHPSCHEQLLTELDSAVQTGAVVDRPSGLVTFTEAQNLPYLDACVKEAFRLFPAAGLPLERITPPEGATICGHQIPGGTIVGCSAWIIHRRPEIFGADPDSYNPSRWLDRSEEELKAMNGTMFQFGMGARTCIGKNISLLEIYKVVPSILRRFEVNLADPSKEWKLHNAWFIKQSEVYATFQRRTQKA